MAGGMSDPDPEVPDARADGAGTLQAFLDKWQARWPEWSVAGVFVPDAVRARAMAWASLLQELSDAAWGGSDPRPGLAKLAWWQEELRGWERGVRRHPLGIELQRLPAPWGGLAGALDSLPASRERAGDPGEAMELVRPFARAAAAVEAALFDGRGEVAPGEKEAELVAAWLLFSRFSHDQDAHVPLSVMAAAGEGDATLAWAAELRRRWPGVVSRHRPRRIWTALARGRLGARDPRRPASGWSTLWRAWRAARG